MRAERFEVFDYDTDIYDFAGWAREVLGVGDLGLIHEREDIRRFSLSEIVPQIEVCRNALAKAFPLCRPLYLDFVERVTGPLYGGVEAFQDPPSFRFHYSGRGSSSFHRDRDYGVRSGRLNVWVPLTPVFGDNSIWIESIEGAEDFAPVALKYGQALVFDGANLGHGSRWNSTTTSRVSFDFRFQPGRSTVPVTS